MPFQVEATGTVESMRSAAVISQVGGLLLHVRFHEGDEVAQGQVLFEIDARPFAAAVQQAEANLSRDLAQADAATRDAARYEALVKDKFVTEEDYQAKQATADALTATVRADSAALTMARLNLGYATIRAPIAGRTGSLSLHEGSQVIANQAATPLVTINQLRPILVRFPVAATQLPELQRRTGQRLHVLVRPAQDTALYDGVLAFVDNHVDAATGTVLLKGHFDNAAGRLWPGEFVDVTLVLGDQADALVVPAQAVMNAQQGTYVFIITPAGTAKQQPVRVQRTLDTLAVIAQGVAPGDMVVTDGQSRLTADARVEVRGEPSNEADPQPARGKTKP